MFKFLDRGVLVTFIDDATDQPIGKSRLAALDLPDSFLESTTLELDDEMWAVVSAEPPFKKLFAKSKRLSVRLRPIETLEAQTLLYSLPTIADELPASEGPMADGSETALLEDDWRQIECISNRFEAQIQLEVADIEAVRRTAGESIGFSSIHVRTRVPEPLVGTTIWRTDLEDRFGPASTALRFHGSGHRISDAFCYDTGGDWLLYGIFADDRPSILALAPSASTPNAPAPNLSELLGAVCDKHSLLLVDWCRCHVAEPGSGEFAAILAP